MLFWLDILSTITVLGITEEWFMLFWLDILWFDRGVVRVVLVGSIVYHYCCRFDKGVVHVVLVILSSSTA
jgi:hypothetical protein